MSPEVTAAIIAASVSFLTLIGTLAAQYFGRRATSRDTKDAFKEQREQLDKTLAEQGKQLDRTLAEQHTRTLNERFATAAGQLGDDNSPTRRQAAARYDYLRLCAVTADADYTDHEAGTAPFHATHVALREQVHVLLGHRHSTAWGQFSGLLAPDVDHALIKLILCPSLQRDRGARRGNPRLPHLE